jgi:hypothetical protein
LPRRPATHPISPDIDACLSPPLRYGKPDLAGRLHHCHGQISNVLAAGCRNGRASDRRMTEANTIGEA